ncbi:MAG: Long-chain-fatty-acid--CoA ligase FadD15 [bacterium ADurb.Bin478]|nr:MAG: Long-chain-fatty-acid--CoA ligase FadD15 [bacterium ADurb.Bin478]
MISSPLKTMTLQALLQRSTTEFADRISLAEVDGPALTYAEWGQRVSEVSEWLRHNSIVAGDRVAILSENKPQWGVAFFAITTMSAVAVPILPDFHPTEIQHILRHSGAKAIFVSEKLYSKIEDATIDSLQSVFLIEDFSLLPQLAKKDKLSEILQEGSKELAKLKEAARKITSLLSGEDAEEALASIIYTSGTTGSSKGVMLTHKNLIFDALATFTIVNLGPGDRMVSMLPLSRAYECTLGLVAPLMKGSAVYYLDKPPTARVLLPALQKIKPTVLLTVPLVIEKIYKNRIQPTFKKKLLLRGLTKIPVIRRRLYKAAGRKLLTSFGGELRCYCIGGAALCPEVELFLREAGFPYAIGYGLTETSPLISGTGPENTAYRAAGKPLSGVEMRIDHPNPKTGEGEILVRGPVVMKGYFQDAKRTDEVLDRDGWFRTGDLGVFDKHGYLYIKGRSKNMILGPNGENIYPEEIEATLNEMEEVVESLVYLRDGKLTAKVCLNYEVLDSRFSAQKLNPDRIEALLEELRQTVNQNVSSFSRIHRMLEQPEPFEKTPTQKIKRYLYV